MATRNVSATTCAKTVFGKNRRHLDAAVADLIAARGHEHHMQGRNRGAGLQGGAEVGDHTHLESQHGAVPCERQLGGYVLVAPLIRGEEILTPRGNPLDGPAELQRQMAGQRLLLVKRALAAEAPADLGRNHAHSLLRKTDGGGEVRTHAV
jgi:hypothetical protein